MTNNLVIQVEDYVKQLMKTLVAHHDYNHVDRVRNWALQIARGEGYQDLELVEVTALLHDIGFPYVKDRKSHSRVGSEMAGRFLREKNLLTEEKITQITQAIKYHGSIREDNEGKLLEILRDADCLEAFGAIGIMRAFTSKSSWPEYNPENIKGTLWGKSGKEYKGVYFDVNEHENTIIDQICMQIHYYDNLATKTAGKLALPLVEYMKNFVLQLESEINAGRNSS